MDFVICRVIIIRRIELGNKSHKYGYEPDSNPQPGGLQCSAVTTLNFKGKICIIINYC